MKTNIFKTIALGVLTVAVCNTTMKSYSPDAGNRHNDIFKINNNAYINLATDLSTATDSTEKAKAWKNFSIIVDKVYDHSVDQILQQCSLLHMNKVLSDEQFTTILGAFKELYQLHKNSKGDWYFDTNGTQIKLP